METVLKLFYYRFEKGLGEKGKRKARHTQVWIGFFKGDLQLIVFTVITIQDYGGA